ncbi:DUF2513 domain-containing protein [Pseudotabrizicola alkalilacus]|uniref:DUF2513 domain-containing protein n=1 Tax=Pseudotabrizicola alkalilacus TaxID=2305252 RepID=A0A411Z5K3_9RHOB|nr:DUF2513 domain-containing protein [Pseudotabrizicola alkalilacus]RGP38341.1 DUF2513 domain-containing protein [Pseudotabrizicola alkalilacus]
MRRDNDLIRSLLFEAEAMDDWLLCESGTIVINADQEDVRRGYHLLLLCDTGLFLEVDEGVFRLMNAGHDWLEAVRDETVWRKTKEAAGKVGGVGLDLMGSIATGFVKQKLAEFGVPLD